MISKISMYHKPFIIRGGAGYTRFIICIFGNQVKLLIVLNMFELDAEFESLSGELFTFRCLLASKHFCIIV